MISAFFLQFVTYLEFPSLTTSALLIIGVAIVGFTFGGMLTLFPSITGDYYGLAIPIKAPKAKEETRPAVAQ